MAVSANESRKIMERIGFPQEAVDTIGDCTERVSKNGNFNALVDEFIAHPENLDSVLERLKALSEQLGENEYTMNMCLLLGACPRYASAMPKRVSTRRYSGRALRICAGNFMSAWTAKRFGALSSRIGTGAFSR